MEKVMQILRQRSPSPSRQVASSSTDVRPLNALETLFITKFKEFNIEVYGTRDEPLFKAKEIGDMLGIVNIRDTIKDYSQKQKVVGFTDTLGGRQQTTFLTEVGMYKVIFKSKKEFAENFQDFVCDLIKEIRSTGKYDLEEQLALQTQQFQQLQLENEEQMKLLQLEKDEQLAIQTKLQLENEEKMKLLQLENEELKREKTYEEIEKKQSLYVFTSDLTNPIDYDGPKKVGCVTKQTPKKRKDDLQTGNVHDIKILFEIKTADAYLVEGLVHKILTYNGYRCKKDSEYFDCPLEYIKKIIIVCTNVCDTCFSSYKAITFEELDEKIAENLESLSELHFNLSTNTITTAVVRTNAYREETNEVALWVSENVVYEQGAFLGQTELYDKYFIGRRTVPYKEKGDFRKEFEKVAVKFKANDRHFNNVSSQVSIPTGNGNEKVYKRGWMGLKFSF